MILDFIKNYYREIIEVVAILASIVICCIKKKPIKVVDTLKELILSALPGFIVYAEHTDKKGEDKKKLVVDLVLNFLRVKGYGDDTLTPYLPFIEDQIESILVTPQKKGW